jgi:hypothetical protein
MTLLRVWKSAMAKGLKHSNSVANKPLVIKQIPSRLYSVGDGNFQSPLTKYVLYPNHGINFSVLNRNKWTETCLNRWSQNLVFAVKYDRCLILLESEVPRKLLFIKETETQMREEKWVTKRHSSLRIQLPQQKWCCYIATWLSDDRRCLGC